MTNINGHQGSWNPELSLSLSLSLSIYLSIYLSLHEVAALHFKWGTTLNSISRLNDDHVLDGGGALALRPHNNLQVPVEYWKRMHETPMKESPFRFICEMLLTADDIFVSFPFIIYENVMVGISLIAFSSEFSSNWSSKWVLAESDVGPFMLTPKSDENLPQIFWLMVQSGHFWPLNYIWGLVWNDCLKWSLSSTF